jgi:hypothetical protein
MEKSSFDSIEHNGPYLEIPIGHHWPLLSTSDAEEKPKNKLNKTTNRRSDLRHEFSKVYESQKSGANYPFYNFSSLALIGKGEKQNKTKQGILVCTQNE